MKRGHRLHILHSLNLCSTNCVLKGLSSFLSAKKSLKPFSCELPFVVFWRMYSSTTFKNMFGKSVSFILIDAGIVHSWNQKGDSSVNEQRMRITTNNIWWSFSLVIIVFIQFESHLTIRSCDHPWKSLSLNGTVTYVSN